jgi:hypothetical protein
VFTLLAAEVGPLAPSTLGEPRESGASDDSPSLQTGGPVEPIDYKFPDDGGAAGGSAISDPSIGLRPDVVPAARPSKKTAVEDQWSADTRVWANTDGTYTLELGQNLNFRDDSGKWTAIDLSLTETKTGEFVPKAAPPTLTLATSRADGTLAELKGDDATVAIRTLTPTPGSKVGDQLEFTGGPVQPTAFVRPTDLGFEFGATFNDVLTEPFAEFVFGAGGLTAALAKDGMTIELRNPGSEQKDVVVGSIGAPSVVDDAGYEAGTSNVTVGLTDQGDGTYLLSYFIAPTWLQAKGRVFPVTLDPSATSIKSIDLGLKGYKAGEPILSRLSSAVKDLVAYKNSTMVSGGVTYEVGGLTTPITQKVLSVAIPPSATAEQVSALAAVAQYADSQGVIMIITVVK